MIDFGKQHEVGETPEQDSDDWLWFNPRRPPAQPEPTFRIYDCAKCRVTWREFHTRWDKIKIRCWNCGQFKRRHRG